MAFGKVASTVKIKNLAVGSTTKSSLIYDGRTAATDQFFLLLIDYMANPKSKMIEHLIADCNAVGLKSFVIASSVKIGDSVEEQKAAKKTEDFYTFESTWKQEFTEGTIAIIAFGRSVRILNKSGDIGYFDFYDDVFSTHRYFCGSAYVGGPDKWIYPVPPLDYAYPFNFLTGSAAAGSSWVCYHTRQLRRQLQSIASETDFSLDTLDTRPIKIHDCSAEESIAAGLSACDNADLLALDTETSGFDQWTDRLGTVQLTADGENAYFFEWATLQKHKRQFTTVLRHAKRLTLANAKFDIQFLYTHGVKGVFATDDTTLLSYAINSDRPKGLKPGTWFWCGTFGGYDDKLDTIKKKMGISNYLQIPRAVLMEYAAIDPVVTWRQQVALDAWCKKVDAEHPNEKIPEWTIWRFYKEIMIPNAKVMTEVQLNGVFFDSKTMDEITAKIQGVIDEEAEALAKEWGVDPSFQFGSADALGQLWMKLGWPKVGEFSTKGYQKTGDDVIQEYERLGMPGMKHLRRYRSFCVARNLCAIGWREFLRKHTDGTERVHPNMNLFGVVSFRHSCNNPNLQQIPSAKEIAHYVKQFFAAPPSVDRGELGYVEVGKWNNSTYMNVVMNDGTKKALTPDLQESEIKAYDLEGPTIYDRPLENNFEWCY